MPASDTAASKAYTPLHHFARPSSPSPLPYGNEDPALSRTRGQMLSDEQRRPAAHENAAPTPLSPIDLILLTSV